PLSGILEMPELRKQVMASLSKLFEQESVRASWWSESEGAWTCELVQPETEDIKKIKDPEKELESVLSWSSVFKIPLQYKDSPKQLFCFEAPKRSLAEVFGHQVESLFQKVSFHQEV